MKQSPNILVISYPAQGHMNPALHFAARAILTGATVTYLTTNFGRSRISPDLAATPGLSIVVFSDGYDNGYQVNDDIDQYNAAFSSGGSKALRSLIHSARAEGRPFSCLVYTILLSWAGDVAAECATSATLLWIQPATVFAVYHHYFNGGDRIKNLIRTSRENPNSIFPLGIPGLPDNFAVEDLPSFLVDPQVSTAPFLRAFDQQFEALNKSERATVLVNTFDSLESEALRALNSSSNLRLTAIGPLIPDSCNLKRSTEYGEWLKLQRRASVIYVSFGSISVLSTAQNEEIAKALLTCTHPFLWVIRDKAQREALLSCHGELEKLGKIVAWSCQVEVLSSPALGCFVTHCGWNSTLESLACGAPLVAFPQWTDQQTNAKLVATTWRTGVRVKLGKDGIVGSEEIERCLEVMMGDGDGEELRRNAARWRSFAGEAIGEGGSSDNNFKAFLKELMQRGDGGLSC